METPDLDNQICQAARQLWSRGLLVGSDGMISAELHRRRYLVTPLGVRRCDLIPQHLATVDVGGTTVDGNHTLDVAAWMPHRIAYQRRSELAGADGQSNPVRATVLATPPMTLALVRRRPDALTLMLAGLPPVTVLEQTEEEALKSAVETHQHIVIRNVGLLCFANDLASVLNELEAVEHAATIELAYEGSS